GFGNPSEGVPTVELTATTKKHEHPLPPDADALKAGDHLYYLHEGGTTVSVAKKGMRYLNDKGKKKVFNVASSSTSPRYGALRSDGKRAYSLAEEQIGWIDLPEGKNKGELRLDRHPPAMIMVADDLFLFR